MTEPTGPNLPPESPEEAAATGTLASRISLRQRSGGIVVPVLTAVVAFLLGGAVVAATGHNPLRTYNDIFSSIMKTPTSPPADTNYCFTTGQLQQ